MTTVTEGTAESIVTVFRVSTACAAALTACVFADTAFTGFELLPVEYGAWENRLLLETGSTAATFLPDVGGGGAGGGPPERYVEETGVATLTGTTGADLPPVEVEDDEVDEEEEEVPDEDEEEDEPPFDGGGGGGKSMVVDENVTGFSFTGFTGVTPLEFVADVVVLVELLVVFAEEEFVVGGAYQLT